MKLAKRGRGNPGRKDGRRYLDMICAFDIETSKSIFHGEWHAFCYVWQFCFDNIVYIGRCLQDYDIFTEILSDIVGEKSIVVYVHNLSYEFQFLSGIQNFANDNVFCIRPHKILKADRGCIEYRCSMLHSNMSLARWTSNFHVKHEKLSGEEYDYNKIRYPWTELSDKELAYQCYDVLGVCECIKTELERDGDNLYTIPLTSTGYVRRDVKRAMKPVSHNLMHKLHMDLELYEMLKRAFRGGDTHANRYFVNRELHNVHSYDRASSYPDVMLNRKFPMSRFLPDPYVKTMDDVIQDIYVREKAALIDIAIYNYKQADRYNGFPYLSVSKCRKISKDCDEDNGRILSAKYLETTVTDVDLKIILKEIHPDSIIVPLKYLSCRYGKLPAEITNLVLKYYTSKTELKGSADDYFYMKSKNLLNSIYGLMVQDPCKDSILFDDGLFNLEGTPTQELLEKYYKRCFTSYAWGVWVTAWARFELRRAIWKVGRFGVYCDTDSVKYIGEHDFSDLNQTYLDNNAFAIDKKGGKHYLGVYEYEGTYKAFATLGAKKYVYRAQDDSLHITIAGVNKKKGAAELEAKGGISSFLLGIRSDPSTGETIINDKGFIFYDGGGNELIYNMERTYFTLNIDGHTLDITRNVVIKDSTYQLGVSRDYKLILEGISEEYLEDFDY